MKVSVALCIYNGAKYIREQLESILNQTKRVDEIVLCDDGSHDDTLAIVEDIRVNSDVTIRVYRNEHNVGFKENFFNAIDRCQGELVFLADQDDVWHSNKVETIVKWFDSHSDKMVVFTDATLIDGDGKPLEGSLWQRFGFDWKKQKYFDHGYALDIWGWSNRATGATMAVRKDFIDQIQWRQYANKFHDSIISWQGVATHSIGYINDKLVDYRLHDAQVCGADDMPVEFHNNPLKPVYADFLYPGFLENDIQFIPETAQRNVTFILERSLFKKTWFGWGPISHIRSYTHFYHAWAYKFFLFDWYISVRHSLKRIFS